jgi:hypothetical protein
MSKKTYEKRPAVHVGGVYKNKPDGPARRVTHITVGTKVEYEKVTDANFPFQNTTKTFHCEASTFYQWAKIEVAL